MGGSEGRSPPSCIPKLTTCASVSEALRSKVSLRRSPPGERRRVGERRNSRRKRSPQASFFDGLRPAPPKRPRPGPSISKFLPAPRQEQSGRNRRQPFGRNHAGPNAVHAPKGRQHPDGRHLENQRAQEGDQRRGQAVVKRGKKRGAKNAKARKQEREG